MPDSEDPHHDLTQVLRRFTDRAAQVRRLANESEAFRDVCEDFALASTTLARLSAGEDRERHSALISDYTLVLAELTREIEAALESADEGC